MSTTTTKNPIAEYVPQDAYMGLTRRLNREGRVVTSSSFCTFEGKPAYVVTHRDR